MVNHNLIILCFSIYYFMLVVSAQDEIVHQAKPECKVPLHNLQNDNSSRNAQLYSQLVQLKIDPTARIFKLFPALHLESDEGIPSRCYDPMVGGVETDIFEQPIYCTLARYFDVHYTQQHNSTTQLELNEKIDNFMEHLHSLVKLILHCRDDVHYSKRTRLGLTQFVVYKSNQLVGLYSANLATLNDDSNPSNISCVHGKFENFETTQPAFTDVRNYAQSFVGPIENQLFNDLVICPNSALVYALVGLLESQLMRCTNGHEESQVEFDPRTNQLLRRLVNCSNPNCESSIEPQTVWKNLFTAACTQTKLAQLLQTGHVMYCEKHKPTDAELMQYLVQYGPLLVYINADEDEFRYYKSRDSVDGQVRSMAFRGKCGGKQANYPVQLVGWRDKYWLIKNSWGEEWGHRGYGFLPIGMNKCSINTMVGW